MKRLAKILAILIAAIIVIVIVAAVALPLFFDPNDYKAEITAMIEDKIGREVSIPGDIELSVFPWLGVSIGRVTVANAPGFGDKPMAEIASADVHVKLLPLLLQQQIEIGTVSIDGLRLRLARNAQGRTNWAGIVEHLQSSGQSAKGDGSAAGEGGQQQTGGGGFELASLQISAVEITDARVTWHDAVTGNSYTLSNFHLSTGTLAEDQPFQLQMGATVAAADRGITSHISLATTITPNISEGIYQFSDLRLEIQAKGPALPGGGQQLTVTGHGVYNLAAAKFALKDLVIQGAGLHITGQVVAQGLNKTPQFSGRVAVAQFDPRAVAANLGIELPELQGENVLTSASLKAQFSATPNSARISRLRINLDDTTLTGSARVTDFSAPAIAFNANVDAFNLDHYLPAASAREAAAEGESTGSGEDSGTTKIDLSFLEGLVLDGKLHVGSLTAYDMTFHDALLQVTARGGVLTIKPLDSGFYEGKIHVVAQVDASGKMPQYSLEASLANLKFAALLEDLVGSDVVSALASLQLNLSSSGGTVAAIKQSLDGTFQFELRDGAFYGFNLASMIAVARSRFLGDASARAAGAAGQKTPFNRFAGKFSIHNGTISGDGMSLDTKYLDIAGSGRYNLVANDLDYTLKVQVDEQGGPLSEVAGLTVPIHLSGNLLSPDYSIDIESMLKGVVKQHLQEEAAEVKQKVKKEVSEEVDQLKKEVTEELGDQVGDALQKKLQEGLSNLFN